MTILLGLITGAVLATVWVGLLYIIFTVTRTYGTMYMEDGTERGYSKSLMKHLTICWVMFMAGVIAKLLSGG